MKKIFGIIFLIFALSLLVACQSDSKVEVSINELEFETKTASFKLIILDPDKEITGEISVKLETKAGSTISTRDVTALEETFSYVNLTSNTEYVIKVTATMGKTSKLLLTEEFLTKVEDNVITTYQQFLAMGANRFGNFELGNDIDFEGVLFADPAASTTTLTKLPFVNPLFPFAGSFDGKGFALKNINFTTTDTYTGVFGYVSTGKISDLVLDNVHIGTVESPLAILKAARVGLLAGYVSTDQSIIENITIKNSSINISNTTTQYTHVGGIIGESNQGSVRDVELENVDINVKTTSFGRVKVGGAIGLMGDPSSLKRISSNANINYTLRGNDIFDKTFSILVGGLVGDYNAKLTNNAIEDVYSNGNINLDLDFGTRTGTGRFSYTVSVGGIAGRAYSNALGAYYAGSIVVDHEKNANEENVIKTFNIGGLFGIYLATRTSSQMVRLGNNQTIEINVSDDVSLRASQSFGLKDTSALLHIGVFGALHLMVNQVSMVDSDPATIYDTLDTTYFTSNFMKDALHDYLAN
jgi:hypothetical protein